MKLKRGTPIKCIKTVFMENGTQCFTEGQLYKTYPYTYREGWDTYNHVTCAKNDQNKRHIIIAEDMNFFNEHFIIIEKER